ncbi:hypothetical protein CRM22_001768, partial [Opisthorchis felineus]
LQNIHSDAFRRLSNIPPPDQAPLETGQCESSLVWNNLALVHHRSGQFHLSGLQLRRALRETDKTVRDAVPQLRSGLTNATHGRTVAQLLTCNKDILSQFTSHPSNEARSAFRCGDIRSQVHDYLSDGSHSLETGEMIGLSDSAWTLLIKAGQVRGIRMTCTSTGN